jgi:hypothetical protein
LFWISFVSFLLAGACTFADSPDVPVSFSPNSSTQDNDKSVAMSSGADDGTIECNKFASLDVELMPNSGAHVSGGIARLEDTTAMTALTPNIPDSDIDSNSIENDATAGQDAAVVHAAATAKTDVTTFDSNDNNAGLNSNTTILESEGVDATKDEHAATPVPLMSDSSLGDDTEAQSRAEDGFVEQVAVTNVNVNCPIGEK